MEHEHIADRVDYRLPTGLEGTLQYHIQCRPGDVASIAIVPGDQGRVPKFVQHLERVREVANNRGLISYTGLYHGVPVTVTSTGMGGPSAAIVYEELANLGVRVLIRVGSVAGLQPEVAEGENVIPYACIRDDGATAYYVPENYPAVASPRVFQALTTAAEEAAFTFHTGINWSHSAFYHRNPEYYQRWARKRVVSMEMEAAALFVIAALRGVEAGFIGTCYANRAEQSRGDAVDLSVESPQREVIQEGVERSIIIALNAAESLGTRL
ncbi:nucleoside phosphorylase [Limnochorda pilosa]|uniref:Uridine phosphorylase n=1 Tax=Limnochorda pilosa TaxID=1555112 RepID=A0A0K2SGM1_LIMPI|nr:nucleoside phosphorylase [Limnochorda pilosa]BAS26258.1 purine phosphorylase [Limnochorda pilosa]